MGFARELALVVKSTLHRRGLNIENASSLFNLGSSAIQGIRQQKSAGVGRYMVHQYYRVQEAGTRRGVMTIVG